MYINNYHLCKGAPKSLSYLSMKLGDIQYRPLASANLHLFSLIKTLKSLSKDPHFSDTIDKYFLPILTRTMKGPSFMIITPISIF
jgi:hypothetical protein